MAIAKRGRETSVTTTTVVKKPKLNIVRSIKPEFKHAIKSYAGLISSASMTVVNLNYFLSEGVKRYELVGTQLDLRSITMRFYASKSQNAAAGYNNSLVRILIIKSDENYTTSVTTVAPANIFRNDGVSSSAFFGTTSHVDGDKVKVLSDKQIIMMPQTSANTNASDVVVNYKVPIKRVEKTKGDNTGIFKNGNYFLVICPQSSGDNTLTSPYNVAAQWSLDFYDA